VTFENLVLDYQYRIDVLKLPEYDTDVGCDGSEDAQ
jgi:hypothetical protein